MNVADLIHVADHTGLIHLADDGPLGLAVGCDSWEWMTVIRRDERADICGDCLDFWQPDLCAHSGRRRRDQATGRAQCGDCGHLFGGTP